MSTPVEFSAETKKRLKLYEKLVAEQRERETQIQDLRAVLVSEIPEDITVVGSEGTFSVARKTKWIYTKETLAYEMTLKSKKKEEEQTGVAKEEKGPPYLIYRQKTDE